MNQILFEMYIGVITNFQKEPDYEYQISYDKVFSRIYFNSTAIVSLLQKQYLYRHSLSRRRREQRKFIR